MKARWFNFRALVVIFVFLILGSLFAFYIHKNIIATVLLTIVFVGLIIFVAVTRKKIAYLLLPIFAFVFGFGLNQLAYHNFNKSIDFIPTNVEGRIYSVSYEDGMASVRLDSVKFDGKNANSNLQLYLYDNSGLFENIEIGSVVSFAPIKLYKADLISDIPNAYLYSNNLRYSATANVLSLTYIKTDKTFAEKIKSYIKENLHNGLSNENAEIAYSALFGDKEMLPENEYSAYRLSGVAHLLAVSGLHVGIIVAILYKLLDLLKIKRWVRVAVVSALLLLYAYICNFSVSVVRASIMTVIMLIAPLVYRQYDSLSALSFAGIVIFLFNPLCIFDVSFLMSFACVAGIIMLHRPIKTALLHTKMPKWLAESIGLSLSAMVALMLIMAFFFKTLNIVSVLANIVIIPIFTVVFSITFVLSMLSLILPFIAYLLIPINPIFNFINFIVNIFAGLPIASIPTINISYVAMLIYFLIIFLIGRMCTAKREYRFLICLPLVAFLIVFMV